MQIHMVSYAVYESGDYKSYLEYIPELLVLRDVLEQEEHAPALYNWLKKVITVACHYRRNQRVCLLVYKFIF